MELYFLRHGLAADRDEFQGCDEKRPLTEEGVRRIKRTAERLEDLGIHPDRIYTSPLLRAVQTAEIVARKLGISDRVVEDDRLALGFGVASLRAILTDESDIASLLLVGHEPDFSETIGALIGGGRVECKKGSLAGVEVSSQRFLSGTLICLLPPKVFLR